MYYSQYIPIFVEKLYELVWCSRIIIIVVVISSSVIELIFSTLPTTELLSLCE